MCVCCRSSFSMSGAHNHCPYHCFRSAVGQAKHFLSSSAAQNCKNIRPEKMWVWSLRSEFWVPNRNWASMARSLEKKSSPEKSESEEEEDDDNDDESCDPIIEKNEGSLMRGNQPSDSSIGQGSRWVFHTIR